MSREEVQKLVDLWEKNENNFQQTLRADPAATVQRNGIKLDPDELDALTNIDWDTVDDRIQNPGPDQQYP